MSELDSQLIYTRAVHRETLDMIGFRYKDELEFVTEHGKDADTCVRLAAILMEYALDLKLNTPTLTPTEHGAH